MKHNKNDDLWEHLWTLVVSCLPFPWTPGASCICPRSPNEAFIKVYICHIYNLTFLFNFPENRTKGAKVTKRRVAVRRLDQSLAASQSMKKLMEEKLALKKTFYESVIAEMKAQTAILKTISEKI
jgi:hypothetical protein